MGETYFMREPQTLDALAEAALVPLIAARRGHRQQLRIWSAACSSGEEPYSIAILLQRLLPDWQDWNLAILATDINEHVLQRARAGIYGEWSFRQTPAEFRQRHFNRTADGRYILTAAIGSCVSFRQLNLARDPLPFDAAAGEPADLILCRNLLIYFEPTQARRLIDRLFGALGPGGWLAVSPSECSQELFARFDAINLSGATLYRKPAGSLAPSAGLEMRAVCASNAGQNIAVFRPVPAPPPVRSQPAVSRAATDPGSLRQRVQQLANAGNLSAALACSERWIIADKCDPAAHYLQAMILQEQGQRLPARRALERALYLEPDFVLAHFALGNLARHEARERDAERHFRTTLRLLSTRAAGRGPAALGRHDRGTAGRVRGVAACIRPQRGPKTRGSLRDAAYRRCRHTAPACSRAGARACSIDTTRCDLGAARIQPGWRAIRPRKPLRGRRAAAAQPDALAVHARVRARTGEPARTNRTGARPEAVLRAATARHFQPGSGHPGPGQWSGTRAAGRHHRRHPRHPDR